MAAEPNKSNATAQALIDAKAASRVHAKDASLYSFSKDAEEYSAGFMGWADLSSNPPVPVEDVKALADKMVAAGMDTAVLIGQGGSTQAAMTMTKFNKGESEGMRFITLDSDSPVRVRELLAEADPATTVLIVSSKSGGTLEMRSMFAALKQTFFASMGEEELLGHLIAISDPGSPLATQVEEEGWAGLLYGEPTVGGRFSALSVFGLLPAALAGIDVDKLVEHGRKAEEACSADSASNPALQLAAFMYDNYKAGRDKISYVAPQRARVLGLWIEQLVAESTGKDGLGILPQVEIDPLLLGEDAGDRCAVVYRAAAPTWDLANDFDKAAACIAEGMPRMDFSIDSVYELAEHFVMWEYATAMCGYLMQVSPFDQPDVASAKAKVLEILDAGLPEASFVEEIAAGDSVEVRLSECCADATDLRAALKALFASIEPGNYFAMNAFLPFTGEGRREALERIRHAVGQTVGVTACLEVGPRYLHSTGQLQKGGPNKGVYLVVSAEEVNDIELVDAKASSLGQLAKSQAVGDFATLADRGRRCMHVHLPDNTGTTLRRLATIVEQVLAEL